MASGAASCLAFVALLLVAPALPAAAATSYTVGDKSGWTIGVDYTTWAGSKSFKAGDNLVFNYAKGQHNVIEVSAADYLACAAASPIDSDSSGATTVALKTGGKHYFLCSIPGHCSAGMKLEVDVSGSGSGSGSSSPSSPTPTTPTPIPTPTRPSPTPTTPIPTPTTPIPTPTTPYTTPTPTTPYTTPTSPACSGTTPVNPVTPMTPVTPGTTVPFMSYNFNGAAGRLPPVALCGFSLVCVVILQLGLL